MQDLLSRFSYHVKFHLPALLTCLLLLLLIFFKQKYFCDTRIPVLFVACKAEHREVIQDFEMTPIQFCTHYKLPPPQYFTCIDKINKDIYVKLATMAAYP